MYISIRNIIENFPNISVPDIKSKIYSQKEYKVEKKYLKETSISRGIGVSELLYQIKFNILENPVCLFCKEKKQNFLSTTDGYTGYCSRLCADKCPLRKQKRKETCIKLFGSESNLVSQRESDKKKWMERYGVDNPTKNKVIADKAITKTRETLLRTTGYDNTFKNPLVRERLQVKQNEIRNETLEKMKETFMKNYGVDNPMKTEGPRTKSAISQRKKQEKKMFSFLSDRILLDSRFHESWELYIQNKIKLSDQWKLTCKKCLKEYEDTILYNDTPFCPVCLPRFTRKSQKEVHEFIESLGVSVIGNTKRIISPLELDIYIPEENLAIEYDGLMFHSFGTDDHKMFRTFGIEEEARDYHLYKTNLCQEKGIDLFHVFEDEWLDIRKKEVWKSLIRSRLQKYLKVLTSQETIIRVVENELELKQFLRENSLVEYSKIDICLGLYTVGGELLQIMSFRKLDESTYELCYDIVKNNINVIGGQSKLFEYFLNNYYLNSMSIITYVDLRYGDSKVYKQLGFGKQGEVLPKSYYFKPNQILQGRQLSKNCLDNSLETEEMYRLGYRKIYDCGNLVFVYTKINTK